MNGKKPGAARRSRKSSASWESVSTTRTAIKRYTRSDHFLLLGGSRETHERMQDTAIRFDEALEKAGKKLPETTLEELIDLLHEIREKE